MNQENEVVTDVASVLHRAFLDQAYFAYLMPQEKRRPAQVLWWLRTMTRYAYRYGEIYSCQESAVHLRARQRTCQQVLGRSPTLGAAVWLRPEDAVPHPLKLVCAGLLQTPLRMGLRGVRRVLRLDGAWHHAPERQYWYLMLLGVDPPHQRQGWGRRLLAPVLAEADAAGQACLLETASAASRRFYERLGFTVLTEQRMGPLPLWIMRRPPQAV